MLSAFDFLLAALAIIIMMVGLQRRWSACRMGQAEERSGDWPGLLFYLLGHKKILKNPLTGISHLFLFWGFLVPLIIIIIAQFRFFLPFGLSQSLSLLMEVLGVCILVGILFFLVRRIKGNTPGTQKGYIFPLFILLAIVLTGFLAEGARLNIIRSGVSWSSPVGWLFSLISSHSPVFMKLMIRFHFFLVLLFIAALPFSSMRHIAAAPLNVYYKRQSPSGRLKLVHLAEGRWGAKVVCDLSWKQLLDAEACTSCGLCEQNCPAFITGKSLSPQKMIQNIFEQMEDVYRNRTSPNDHSSTLLESAISRDEIWSCTTCMACAEHCPVYVDHVDIIVELRRNMVYKGIFDKGHKMALQRTMDNFNPWGMPWNTRSRNTGFKEVREKESYDILYWVGCAASFDDRALEIVKATSKILEKAGISVGILGTKERCCGDFARRIGDEGLFRFLSQKI